MYRATAQIEIQKETVNLLSFKDVVNVDTAYIDYYNTQYKILKSRTLAETVAEELVNGRKYKDEEGNEKRRPPSPQDAKLTRKYVLAMTRIEPVRNSRLVNIIAQSRIPEQAARMANTLAEAYIEQDRNKKVEDIRAAAAQLRKELNDAKEKVDRSEQQFMEFKEKTNIVGINEKQQELAKLTEASGAAAADRLTKQTRYEYLKNLSLDELRHEQEVVNSELIQKLKTEEFNADQNVKKLAQTYGEKHPKLISAKEGLTNVTKEIDGRILKIVDEVKNAYLEATKEEESLLAAIVRKKLEVLEFNRKVNNYERLDREVKANKKIYDEILTRGRQTEVSQRTKKSNVRIVDRADVPERPFRPRTKVNIALAIVAGLVLGCGGAFLVEHLNDKVEDPQYIEVELGKPVLGAVPKFSANYSTLDERGRIADISPRSNISEAYKKVLAGIQYSSASDNLKTILVTSAGPAEGKTTTLTNLGISAARNGKKVLLVDCDLRKPTIHKIFDLKKEEGVTDYLVGEADLDQVIQETGIEDLFAIARGGSSPNPSRLISSERMKKLTELVRDKFDLILFDSPPCTVVADPLVMANVVDAVINVTRSAKSPKKMVEMGVRDLERANANILGFVFNEVDKRESRYYYYGYGYGYRYRYSYYTEEGDGGSRGSEKSAIPKSKRAREHSNSA